MSDELKDPWEALAVAWSEAQEPELSKPQPVRKLLAFATVPMRRALQRVVGNDKDLTAHRISHHLGKNCDEVIARGLIIRRQWNERHQLYEWFLESLSGAERRKARLAALKSEQAMVEQQTVYRPPQQRKAPKLTDGSFVLLSPPYAPYFYHERSAQVFVNRLNENFFDASLTYFNAQKLAVRIQGTTLDELARFAKKQEWHVRLEEVRAGKSETKSPALQPQTQSLVEQERAAIQYSPTEKHIRRALSQPAAERKQSIPLKPLSSWCPIRGKLW